MLAWAFAAFSAFGMMGGVWFCGLCACAAYLWTAIPLVIMGALAAVVVAVLLVSGGVAVGQYRGERWFWGYAYAAVLVLYDLFESRHGIERMIYCAQCQLGVHIGLCALGLLVYVLCGLCHALAGALMLCPGQPLYERIARVVETVYRIVKAAAFVVGQVSVFLYQFVCFAYSKLFAPELHRPVSRRARIPPPRKGEGITGTWGFDYDFWSDDSDDSDSDEDEDDGKKGGSLGSSQNPTQPHTSEDSANDDDDAPSQSRPWSQSTFRLPDDSDSDSDDSAQDDTKSDGPSGEENSRTGTTPVTKSLVLLTTPSPPPTPPTTPSPPSSPLLDGTPSPSTEVVLSGQEPAPINDTEMTIDAANECREVVLVDHFAGLQLGPQHTSE